MLFKWLRQRQDSLRPPRHAAERRTTPRYDVNFDVWLKQHDIAPVAGSVINVSRNGAAIRIHGWNVPVPSAWPTRLTNGDEVWVTGLIDTPLFCWVIAVDDGVLRVRFAPDETMREQLREMIATIQHHDLAPRH
jgi:PilZ domain